MLETPSIPRYQCNSSGDNATGADNQQERLLEASRILRDHTPDSSSELKRWSHLHGDMQGDAPLRAPPLKRRYLSKGEERNSLSGKFRPARMA